MKAIHKILGLTAAMSVSLFSCDENNGIRVADTTVANPATNTANFFFINATTGGPSLDFFVNGDSVGLRTVALGNGLKRGYKNVPITTPGLNNIPNTSIRAKASSGTTVGGILGSADLIFRATSTGIGNLVAAPNARYTFIAVDEIERPRPLRTFSVSTVTNALTADITYYNRTTRQQISNDAFKALTAPDQANFVSIGMIPTGVSDPGGVRYYVLTDTSYPATPAIDAAVFFNQSFVRFVHASPNAPGVFVRLVPAVGAPIPVVTAAALNVMSVAGGFSPSAGSRTATGGFTVVNIGAPTNTYDVEIHTNVTFTALALSVPNVTLTAGKVYTIVARGLVGGTGASALGASIGQHN